MCDAKLKYNPFIREDEKRENLSYMNFDAKVKSQNHKQNSFLGYSWYGMLPMIILANKIMKRHIVIPIQKLPLNVAH